MKGSFFFHFYKVFLGLVFFSSCTTDSNNPVSEGENLKTERLREVNLQDSASLSNFYFRCEKEKNPERFITNYYEQVKKGTKVPAKWDLYFLKMAEKDSGLIREKTKLFNLLLSIARINMKFHLDTGEAEKYFFKALDLARQEKDTCLLLSAHDGLQKFYLNMRHDLLLSFSELKNIEGIENSLKKSGKTCEWNPNTNISFSVLYFYLEDFPACISYLNAAIQEEINSERKAHKLFDYYKRRSFFEYELGQFANAHKSIDTAIGFVQNQPGGKAYENKALARRYVIFCREKNFAEASKIYPRVDLKFLEGPEYYIFLDEVIKVEIEAKSFEKVKKYLDLYRLNLKPWNNQYWMSYYELSHRSEKAQENFSKALEDFENYLKKKELVHNEARQNALIAQQIKYEVKEREKEIALQAAELSIQVEKNRLLVSGFLSTVLFLLLIFSGFAFYKLKESQKLTRIFSQKLISNTETERNRIARDLHDDLGQQLLLIKNDLVSKNETENTKIIDRSIETVRTISRELFPAMLEKVGLKSAIETMLELTDERNEIFISSELNFHEERVEWNNRLQVYRIIQESINNIMKYASAKAVRVEMTETENYLKLCIQDNGIGFNVDEKLNSEKSFGLIEMQQRANSIQSLFSIQSKPGEGTRIELQIPLKKV